jgi:hypothetical protein
MATTTTAEILEAIADRIEALAPDGSATEDDSFHPVVGLEPGTRGHRAVAVGGQPGRRKLTGGRTCSDWETVVTVETRYPDATAELGERSTYARAVEDAEDVLADLYDWAVADAAILKFTPDLAIVTEDGDGNLVVSRTIAIEFQR